MAKKTQKQKTLGDLKPNPKNPRKITDKKIETLKKTLAEFGDLSGFVYNVTTKRLVGGHQRQKSLPANSKIVVHEVFGKPTKTGTVAHGWVIVGEDKLPYREVKWDETKEYAANIAANKGAGEWDESLLSEMMRDIDEFGFDLDLTGFDADERSDLLIPTLNPNEGSEDEQSSLDKKSEKIFTIKCPHCGEEFEK
jgi:hypothetical protein